MCRASLPTLIPTAWERTTAPNGMPMLLRRWESGLLATYTVDRYCGAPGHDPPPLGRIGNYRHLVLSRPDRYPGWDEMRDLVRGCGLFDRSRDVFMLIPPDSEYVNVCQTAFHWLQEVGR